jgi:hypothetical protein
VRIGQGRDAAGTSFATIFGGAVMSKWSLRCSLELASSILPSIPLLLFRIIRTAARPERQSKSDLNRDVFKPFISAIAQKEIQFAAAIIVDESHQATTRVILFRKWSYWKKEKPGKLVFSFEV